MGDKLVSSLVFNAAFHNISVISLRSVLLMDETGEYHRPVASHKLYHTMLYTSSWSRFKLTTSVVIGIHCIGNCKSNYHTITTTTALVGYKGGVIPYIYSRRSKRKYIASLLMGINDATFWLKHGRSKRLWIKLLDYYGLNVYKVIQI